MIFKCIMPPDAFCYMDLIGFWCQVDAQSFATAGETSAAEL